MPRLRDMEERSRARAESPHRSAAVWLYGMLQPLLFREGNRPTAVLAMEADYEVSGYRVDPDTEAFNLLIVDITGGKLDEEEVAVRLLSMAKKVKR